MEDTPNEQTKESNEQTKESNEQTKESNEQTKESNEQNEVTALVNSTSSIGSESVPNNHNNTNEDDPQIHNLTVEDAVTQIEIEQDTEQKRNIIDTTETMHDDDNDTSSSIVVETIAHEDDNDSINVTLSAIVEPESQSHPNLNENNGNSEPTTCTQSNSDTTSVDAPVETTTNDQDHDTNMPDMDHNTSKQPPNTMPIDVTMNDTDSSTTDNKPSSARILRSHNKSEDEPEDEIDGTIEENGDRSTNDDEDDDISMKNCVSSNPDDPDDNFDADAPCGVCWKVDIEPGNGLVYCDGCNVPLHQMCYCVGQVPKGDYYCKVCQYQVDAGGKPDRGKDYLGRKCKCSICQLRFRSKKLAYTSQKMDPKDAKKQKWCHVICAQYISETWFDETDTDLNGVCNVDGIREQRYLFECAYCGRSKGAKVFCSIIGCGTRFHASCGLVNECKLLDVADPAAEYSNRVVYCPAHYPEDIKKTGTELQQKRLKQSQDITISGNQNNLGWGSTWDQKVQHMTAPNHNHTYNIEDEPEDPNQNDDEGYVVQPRRRGRKRSTRKSNTNNTNKKGKKRGRKPNHMKSILAPPNEPPPLAPIYSRRGGFFQAIKPTGPRSMGAGPGHRAKKKFAANHKKRKEPPMLNGNSEPPNKKQRISPPTYNNNKPSNPKLIPKRTMPKYSSSPLNKEREKREKEKKEREKERTQKNAKDTVQQLIARSQPKKFEQKGKVRLIKPNIVPITHGYNAHSRANAQVQSPSLHRAAPAVVQQPPSPQLQAPIPPNPPHVLPPSTPYKVFPKRPQEIWNTRMVHAPEASTTGASEIGKLDFKVTFVWRAGCKLVWPFANIPSIHEKKSKKPRENIHCSWKKDFAEIEKYMKEIRPGGKKQHLSHHWMLCEIHPYSTDDVSSYGDFCNYYKDLNKVSAAMCKSVKHQHLLFYLCPPDEVVLPETYLDDIFHSKIPKGLLWCLIFVKNLNLPTQNNVVNSTSVGSTKSKSSKQQDPRKKHKAKEKRKKKEKEKEKEKSVSLGVEVDGGNLLGMLDGLSNTLKDEANINDNNEEKDTQIVLTNSQEF
eukprot:435642_1